MEHIFYCSNCNSTYSSLGEKKEHCPECGKLLDETTVLRDTWRGYSAERKAKMKAEFANGQHMKIADVVCNISPTTDSISAATTSAKPKRKSKVGMKKKIAIIGALLLVCGTLFMVGNSLFIQPMLAATRFEKVVDTIQEDPRFSYPDSFFELADKTGLRWNSPKCTMTPRAIEFYVRRNSQEKLMQSFLKIQNEMALAPEKASINLFHYLKNNNSIGTPIVLNENSEGYYSQHEFESDNHDRILSSRMHDSVTIDSYNVKKYGDYAIETIKYTQGDDMYEWINGVLHDGWEYTHWEQTFLFYCGNEVFTLYKDDGETLGEIYECGDYGIVEIIHPMGHTVDESITSAYYIFTRK